MQRTQEAWVQPLDWKAPLEEVMATQRSLAGYSPCVLSHVGPVWLFENSMDCSSPGSSGHGILHAIVLAWIAISSSRGSSQPRDQTCIFCIGRWILNHCATWEAQGFMHNAQTHQTVHIKYMGFWTPIKSQQRRKRNNKIKSIALASL